MYADWEILNNNTLKVTELIKSEQSIVQYAQHFNIFYSHSMWVSIMYVGLNLFFVLMCI